jgi:hypothetical protein
LELHTEDAQRPKHFDSESDEDLSDKDKGIRSPSPDSYIDNRRKSSSQHQVSSQHRDALLHFKKKRLLKEQQNNRMPKRKQQRKQQQAQEKAPEAGMKTAAPPTKATAPPTKDTGKRQNSGENEEELRKQLKEMQDENVKLAKENADLSKPSKPTAPVPTAPSTAPSINQHIPMGLSDEITMHVKTEIWRDVKFLGSEAEISAVCQCIIQSLPQLSHLNSTNPKVLAENVSNFKELYTGVVTKAINVRRSDVVSDLKKRYEKRGMDKDKYLPTVKELRKVILRKDLQPEEEPVFEEEEPAADASDEDKAAFQAKKAEFEKSLQEIKTYNEQVERNHGIFEWYWDELLPAVASKHRWGTNLRKNCTITKGVLAKDPQKKLITDSDEGFVIVAFENAEKRWPYCLKCKKNNKKPDKSSPEYQTRWCDDNAGQKKFGGWTNKGRQRFAGNVLAVAKNKAKDHVEVVEKWFLESYLNGSDSPDSGNEDGDDSGNGDDGFGGKGGEVSFIGKDFTKIDLSQVDSDLESLGDDFRAPKKPKSG